jgi:hypothetical protein
VFKDEAFLRAGRGGGAEVAFQSLIEAIEAAGVYPKIGIPEPALGTGLQLAFCPIGEELEIIHKAEQPTGESGVEIGAIGFHQLHPIESQDHREEVGQRFLSIRHWPACLGAVGG